MSCDCNVCVAWRAGVDAGKRLRTDPVYVGPCRESAQPDWLPSVLVDVRTLQEGLRDLEEFLAGVLSSGTDSEVK